MAKKYSINEISQLLNIPKSTLRYWEKEKIIQSRRNDNNDYREYTIDEVVAISDVVFYRNLNYPLKYLKDFYNVPLQTTIDRLNESYDAIEQKILDLTVMQANIKQRLHHYHTYLDLCNDKPAFDEPFFSQIVHMELTSALNLNNYLNDQSVLALNLEIGSNPTRIYGTIPDCPQKEEVIWEKKEGWKYLPCLVEITDNYVNWDKLEPKFNCLREKNVEIGHVIVSFLVTDKSTDYYQGWIEYKEK